ncbi:Vitamin B12 import ATP-binding protein BtuD [Streptomyces tendae]
MIRFEDVSVTYDGAAEPTVRAVDFEVPEGELVLLAGPSGVGKSTVLGAVGGLVPHFTGGTLSGRVTVAGRDTRTHKPRELADVVGTVGQDPLSHFVTDTVEDELAYGMESLGLAPDVMRRRVEETLDLLGLSGLRSRPIATLSGGQQQRVAIGSVLTPHPDVLVLDEPGPLPRLLPGDVAGLGRRPRRHDGRPDPGPRHPGPEGAAPRDPQGGLRDAGHLREGRRVRPPT